MLFLRSKGNIWYNSRKLNIVSFSISLAFLAVMVCSIQNQLCIFQKAVRRWRKKESYVIEKTFSNVYFSPFFYPLYLLWIIAFSLKPVVKKVSVFGSVFCLWFFWYCMLTSDTFVVANSTDSALRIAYRYTNNWYITNSSSFKREDLKSILIGT